MTFLPWFALLFVVSAGAPPAPDEAAPDAAAERVFIVGSRLAEALVDRFPERVSIVTKEPFSDAQIVASGVDLSDLSDLPELPRINLCDLPEEVTGEYSPGDSVHTFLNQRRCDATQRFAPRAPAHAGEVARALEFVDERRLRKTLWTFLDDNPDRDARGPRRDAATRWIRERLEPGTGGAPARSPTIRDLDEVSPDPGRTSTTSQKTLWIEIPGTSATGRGVVLGGHIDTTAGGPGADDNASGVCALIEIYEAIRASRLQFRNDLHFFFYAAEEQAGFTGSRAAVAAVGDHEILAAVNFDMVGYRRIDELDHDLYLWSQYVDANLSRFAEDLASLHLGIPAQRVGRTACGRCNRSSDHVTWHDAGVPVVFPFEAHVNRANPFRNSKRDTHHLIDVAHMMRFVKLGVALAVELAEPVSQPSLAAEDHGPTTRP